MDPDVMAQGPDAGGAGHGEDSQESLTLQDALSPLLDTQPRSSQPSPLGEGHQTHPVQVQLLSRPKEFTDSDLNVDFAFAPRVKINPGQYKRRLPSKPINIVSEEGPNPITQHASSPPSPQDFQQPRPVPPTRRRPFRDVQKQSPPQTSDEVRPDQDVPERQVPTSVAPLKRPPFKDVQLPMPLPTANTIIAPVPRHRQDNRLRSPETVGSISEVQGSCSALRSFPHIPASRPAQASRTSLPNDVSVSSPHPPRKIPGEYSPRPAPVNRPLRDEHHVSSRLETPSTRAPSCSSTQSRSNVKKKRSADQYHERPSSYRGRTIQRSETPCQPTSTPQNELHETWRRKVNESMASCAGVLNRNFASLEEEAKEHIKSINSLKRHIKKQEQKLARYEADTSIKTNVIQELESERAGLLQQLEDSKVEVNARSSRLSKLEEKCRTYKEYLNEAIAEQQNLYKATKDKCDGAISQMKEEEGKRRALQKQELEQAEAAREHLRQVVKATVDEFSRKEHEFKTTIDNLNEKVQERNAEAVRERERVTTILQQNEGIASLQNNLNDLGGKIGQVVSIVNDLASRQNNRDDSLVNEVQAKLDQMMERLQGLDVRVQSPTVITQNFEEVQERSVALILDKLKPILDSQTETKETLQHFMTDLEDKQADLWTAINEREDLLEDLVRERQNENAELASMLQHDLDAKEGEFLEQSQQLQEMEETLAQRQGVIDGLRDEIADLERDQARDMEQSDRLEQLRAKHEKLEGEAKAKAALVVELQTKLHESKLTITSQTQEYKKKTESLQQWMDEQMARAQAAQVQAVEKAQRETLQEANKTKTEFENRLNQALGQRAMLQKELDTAKAHVLTLEKDSDSHGQKMARLETELEKAKSEDAGMREEAKQKDEAHRVALEEHSELVAKLQTELTVWEKKFSNLLYNAQAYDKAAFVVLGHLKQWTQQNTTIQDLASEMSKSQGEGIRQRFDSRFKPLVEMEVLQRAVIKYCQDQGKPVDALTRFRQDHNDDAESLTHATADLSLAAGLAENSTMLAETLLDRARRVTLRSPAEMSPHHRPPSVNTEQARRRTASPPKSIMKAVPYDIASGIFPSIAEEQSSQEEEEMQQRTNGRRHSVGREVLSEESKSRPRRAFRGSLVQGGTMLNHGPYNRPVARSNNRPDLPVDATASGSSQTPISSIEDLREDDVHGLSADSRKRQEAFGQDQSVASKRTKRTPAIKGPISTPRLSPSQESVEDVPTAPRKRNQRSLDVQSASPIRTSKLSQAVHRNQNAAGLLSKGQGTALRPFQKLSGGNSSRSDSQEPLSLFYQRRQSGRGNEDSQQSMAFSQDAFGDGETSLSMTRRFSGMP